MGDGVAYCGQDEHEVTLTRDFYLGQHEITNQEYLEMVQWAHDTGRVTATASSVVDNLDGSTEELLDLDDPHCEIAFCDGVFVLRDAGYGTNPDHPVKEVTWFGAVRYCDWLSEQAGLPRAYEHSGNWSCNGGDPYGADGYRLATDAEWEYAAQWDDERIYPWGNAAPDCGRANFYHTEYCVGWTSPVGSYPDAPEALGFSDLAGNVFEWCNDWLTCDLGPAAVVDPSGPGSGHYRVLRGGSWGYGGEIGLRCAFRGYSTPHDSYHTFGFRVARTAGISHTDGQPSTHDSQCLLAHGSPNPFTNRTSVVYTIPDSLACTRVRLNVYTVSGRLVRALVDDGQPAGQYTAVWDGTDDQRRPVEPGFYFMRLKLGERRVARPVLFVR
jgi:formylglycine-generating enzyme required for sulfatase activity